MDINPEHSLEGRMLKLKLQYFGYLMGRADSLEKTVMLVKNLPVMQETPVQFLDRGDLLEKG